MAESQAGLCLLLLLLLPWTTDRARSEKTRPEVGGGFLTDFFFFLRPRSNDFIKKPKSIFGGQKCQPEGSSWPGRAEMDLISSPPSNGAEADVDGGRKRGKGAA